MPRLHRQPREAPAADAKQTSVNRVAVSDQRSQDVTAIDTRHRAFVHMAPHNAGAFVSGGVVECKPN